MITESLNPGHFKVTPMEEPGIWNKSRYTGAYTPNSSSLKWENEQNIFLISDRSEAFSDS